jgi:hypothetical protein
MRSNSLMTISLQQWRTACITGNPLLFTDECNCERNPLLDELEDHISTACGQGGFQIMTHDSVKFCIKNLLNSCGIKTRVEVAEYFRVADPENNQRPDLYNYNAPDFNKPVVADVCITCPRIPVAAATPLPLSAARKPGRAAEVARNGKETKYKTACDANANDGLELLPLIIESTGRIGEPCNAFLIIVLMSYSKDNEPVYRQSLLCRLSRLSLSCCLQTSIAASIDNRSKLIDGDSVFFSSEYI